MPEAIYNTEIYFKNRYQEEWIRDDFAKRVIKGIDRSEVLDSHLIRSPVLGLIPPTQLSGGTKTLLLIKNCPQIVFNASNCCDKCARYILELSLNREITINLRHIMHFPKAMKARVLNEDAMVDSMEQLLLIAAKYV